MYGKSTETAIAAMSLLAELYDGGKTRLSAVDIADRRGLQRPFVAKVLNTLSQAGLVTGSRGPGGGFALAHPPKDIRLYEVFQLFERADRSDACPFGGGICGQDDPCPIHDKFIAVQHAIADVLHGTTFEEFQLAAVTRIAKAATPRKAATPGKTSAKGQGKAAPRRPRGG